MVWLSYSLTFFASVDSKELQRLSFDRLSQVLILRELANLGLVSGKSAVGELRFAGEVIDVDNLPVKNLAVNEILARRTCGQTGRRRVRYPADDRLLESTHLNSYHVGMAKGKELRPGTPQPIPEDEDRETMAAIDEGLTDAKAGRTVPIDEVRKLLPKWTSVFSSRKER
jgi:hypothetical protein